MNDFAASFDGAQVLITGGLGFIGSTLAHRLVAQGARVTLVDSLIPIYGGNLRNIAGIENQVNVNIADVRDQYSMDYLVQGQDYLFNLAGQSSHMDSMRDPYADLDINCRAQLSILEACRKHNSKLKVVYTSTRQIYGKPDFLPVDERHLLHPTDVNGVNKMAGEWYHIVYNNVYGIRACALRLTNTIGPRMRVKDARQTFLGIWIKQLIEEEPIQVWGDGTQIRDFTYVDDCVDALLMAAASPAADGQIFNLGSDETINLRDLAALLIEINGAGSFDVIPFPADRKPIDIGDYYADYRLIQGRLGWRPRVALRDGLLRTLEFYRAEREHYW
ncbi:NAD-dependent epimerase [Kouleothrix aurantiaca]|jgi:UDP-glucose 4-epimerase|uniref:NAD-dependent epimerase n=1 Tax=Kouleothrix aurantiaca TaxID=186479 RepID=A0A0P9CZL5_9CHLR|nr:NAD-dependent epimerase [Kouleothrix aurantiaca]